MRIISILLSLWIASYVAAQSQPTNLSPANGTTGLSTTTATTFSWTCTGATSYNLVIDTRSPGSNLVNTVITASSYSIILPNQTTTYVWHLHGINGGYTGPESPDQIIHTKTNIEGTLKDSMGFYSRDIKVYVHSLTNTTITDSTISNGSYQLLIIPVSGYICFSSPNYVRDSVAFDYSNSSAVGGKAQIGLIKLAGTPYSLSGHVKNSKGAPINGATLTFFMNNQITGSMTTDIQGYYSTIYRYGYDWAFRVTKTGYSIIGDTISSTHNFNFLHDTAGGVMNGNTVANFLATDTVKPTISLTSPAGGETWLETSHQNITWTASDNESVTSRALYYSVDNGSTWTLIDSATTNTGSYTWTIPSKVTTQGKVKAIAYDLEGNSSTPAISPAFTIQAQTPGDVIILAPIKGSTLTDNSVSIKWTQPDFADSFHVKLTTNNATIKDTTIADTSLMVTLDNNTYYVQVQGKNLSVYGSIATDTFTVNVPSTSVRNLKTGLSITGASSRAGVISYTLATDQRIILELYDLQGRTVMAMDKACKAGRYSVPIGNLSRGNYLVRFWAGDYHQSKFIMK